MFFRLSSLHILHLDMDAVRAAHKPPIGLPGLFSALRGHQNLQRVSLEFHPMDLQNPDAGEDLVDSLNFELGATGRLEQFWLGKWTREATICLWILGFGWLMRMDGGRGGRVDSKMSPRQVLGHLDFLFFPSFTDRTSYPSILLHHLLWV